MFESSEPRLHFALMFSVIGTGSISFFGGVLGILMRFDLITKEKESGTLKTLLSHLCSGTRL